MKKTAALVRAYPPWLWESRYFWLTVSGAVGVPAVVLVCWPAEHIIRYAGLGLQLGGVGTVWLGIHETRKLFEHPSFVQQARAWFSRRPRYGGRFVGAAGSVLGAATSSGRAYVWHGAGPAATIDQRIEALEQNLVRVRDDLSRFQSKTEEDIRRQERTIKQEQQERDKADQEIRNKLEATETGGLHISAMGALWLLAGVVMGTVPDDLARWLG